jgi:hypothetical protein
MAYNEFMGFRKVKSKVIDCLNSGYVFHEQRGDIDIKNLLSTGAVSVSCVTNIIGRARGSNYSCSPHHFDSSIDVHVIKAKHLGKSWYIKWYFIDPNCVFISVHN